MCYVHRDNDNESDRESAYLSRKYIMFPWKNHIFTPCETLRMFYAPYVVICGRQIFHPRRIFIFTSRTFTYSLTPGWILCCSFGHQVWHVCCEMYFAIILWQYYSMLVYFITSRRTFSHCLQTFSHCQHSLKLWISSQKITNAVLYFKDIDQYHSLLNYQYWYPYYITIP